MWFGGLRRAGLDSVSVSLSLSFSLSRPGVSPGALLPWLVARVTGNDREGCCIATARASRDENDKQTGRQSEVGKHTGREEQQQHQQQQQHFQDVVESRQPDGNHVHDDHTSDHTEPSVQPRLRSAKESQTLPTPPERNSRPRPTALRLWLWMPCRPQLLFAMRRCVFISTRSTPIVFVLGGHCMSYATATGQW